MNGEKKLDRAIVILMTLGGKSTLDEAGRAALDEALTITDAYRGSTVAQALIRWMQNGQIRRDPRPAPVREVGSTAPLRKREPFLGGL